MLTVRQAQFAVLSQLEVQKFEDWTLSHLHRFFPNQCAALGEQRLRQTIQAGVRRAAGHRITSKRDVCKYIDLMVVLGRDFDTDPRFPWAKSILIKPTNSSARMRDLIEIARKRLRHS